MRSHLLRNIQHCLYAAAREKQQSNSNDFDPGRRKSIQQLGLAAAGLATGALTKPLFPRYNSAIKPKIAILGAGVAGLHCAYVLQKAGLDATVYEGAKRVGGRMFSLHDRFGKGLNTEAGGEFLDSNHADMLGLAAEFSLPLLDVTMDSNHFESAIYYFQNIKYNSTDLVNGFLPMVDRIVADRVACGEEYDSPFAEQLDKQSLEQYVNSFPCDEWIKQLLVMAYVGEFGLDGGDQSALNFLSLIGFPQDGQLPLFGDSDERYKVIGGNSQIIYHLQKAVADKIKIESTVKSIQSKGRRYLLIFADGSEAEADYVVCTIPYTLLRNMELKIPNMSLDKKRCIQELGYGMNNKLLLGMNQRIWRYGSRPTEGYTYDRDIHTGWDNSHMQNNNQGTAGFTVFLGGTPSLNLARNAEMSGNKRILNQSGLDFYIARLDQLYAGFKNNFSGDQELITWSSNPWSLGSYSCYKTGQWFSISGHEGTPIGKNFLFAGEHCSSRYQGFMNGAAETGRLAAEEIISQLMKKK